MKKSYLLSGIVALNFVAGIHAMKRPVVYKTIDGLFNSWNVDWPAIFALLDSMQGVIDVNEYRTESGRRPLLEQAVLEKNFLAVKTLLEKYKANPNVPSSFRGIAGMPSLSILSFARQKGDNVIIKLLLHYGAKE